MTHATILNLGTFALAIPGAIASATDQIQKIKKKLAKKRGRMQKPTFSDSHPIWSGALTLLMVFSLIAGFWMVFHLRVQSHSIVSVATPSSIAAASGATGSPPPKLQALVKPRIKPQPAPSFVTPTPSQPVPTPIQQNDHGIINNGGVSGSNQTVEDNRQYGVPKPPPLISVTQRALQDNEAMNAEERSHPGIESIVIASDDFYNPAFVVSCNRPCTPILADVTDGFSSAFPYDTNKANTYIYIFSAPNPIMKGIKVEIRVRSKDSDPISVELTTYQR